MDVKLLEQLKALNPWWELGVVGMDRYRDPAFKRELYHEVLERMRQGDADQVVSVIRSSKMGVFFQYVMVTDEPVDVTNLPETLHAALCKTHPLHGVQIMPLAPGHPLIPFSDLHDKMHSRGASMTLDATTPIDWLVNDVAPKRVSFKESYSQEIQNKVNAKWAEYGIVTG